MKKSLIALAVLAAAGTASAQSSVTLGGILKEGVGRTSLSGTGLPLTGGALAAYPTFTTGSNTALIDGSSRILISGVEDLGGGTSAYFQVDSRFRMDESTSNTLTGTGVFAGGNTWLGLRGGWGSFQAGKLDTHYCTSVNDDIAGNGTALALQASSCALQGYVNGSTAGRSVAVTSRAANVLRYTTPNMAGFTGMLTYSFNPYGSERAPYLTGVAGSNAGRGIQLAANYDQGPLAVRFSHWTHKLTGAPSATTTGAETTAAGAAGTAASQRAWLLGVGYDFGMAKVGLTYDRSTLRDLTGGAGAGVTEGTRNVWILPVTVPVGAGQIIASYARASNVKTNLGTAAGTDAKLFSIGYNHNLSKRTSLGASWSRLNNGTAGQYQLYTNSSLGNAGMGTGVPPGTDQTLIYLGMRHVF